MLTFWGVIVTLQLCGKMYWFSRRYTLMYLEVKCHDVCNFQVVC